MISHNSLVRKCSKGVRACLFQSCRSLWMNWSKAVDTVELDLLWYVHYLSARNDYSCYTTQFVSSWLSYSRQFSRSNCAPVTPARDQWYALLPHSSPNLETEMWNCNADTRPILRNHQLVPSPPPGTADHSWCSRGGRSVGVCWTCKQHLYEPKCIVQLKNYQKYHKKRLLHKIRKMILLTYRLFKQFTTEYCWWT